MMIECIKFKSVVKGSLMGYADFYVPKMGIEIYGCSLHRKDGRRWINLPSKEYKNELGETKYAPVVRFKEKEHLNLFSEECKKAIDKKCMESPEQNQELPQEQELPF